MNLSLTHTCEETKRLLSNRRGQDFSSALALRIIVFSLMRPGAYARPWEDLGVFSLRRRHVKLGRDGKTISFQYPGKQKLRRRCDIQDPVLHAAILSSTHNSLQSRIVGSARVCDVEALLRRIHNNSNLTLNDIFTLGVKTLYNRFMEGRPYTLENRKQATRRAAEVLNHTPEICKQFYTFKIHK